MGTWEILLTYAKFNLSGPDSNKQLVAQIPKASSLEACPDSSGPFAGLTSGNSSSCFLWQRWLLWHPLLVANTTGSLSLLHGNTKKCSATFQVRTAFDVARITLTNCFRLAFGGLLAKHHCYRLLHCWSHDPGLDHHQ